MRVWTFHLLGNAGVTVSDEQKNSIVEQLTQCVKNDMKKIIEFEGDNGVSVGFPSDSIVAWISAVVQPPSQIVTPPQGLLRAG